MMKHLSKHKSRHFRRFLKANEAVSALEYALVVGIIAVAVGGALVVFSGNIRTAVTNIGDDVADIDTTGGAAFTGTAPGP